LIVKNEHSKAANEHSKGLLQNSAPIVS